MQPPIPVFRIGRLPRVPAGAEAILVRLLAVGTRKVEQIAVALYKHPLAARRGGGDKAILSK